ncbi:MAG TPA: TA system VapC family ribonuclease toxin [Terracidiphilus sp.]
MSRRHLLDLNVLIPLTDPDHIHYQKAQAWFDLSREGEWGLCPLTESGFVRVTTNPAYLPRPRTLAQATYILDDLAKQPGYAYWPIMESWTKVTAPFRSRIFGHQQITDAYLLGLAIRDGGVLVTFDRGVKHLAGAEYARNLLVLE